MWCTQTFVKELVFKYIEHSIFRYDFVYDIIMYLFQVLPLLHWTSEFSKIMIIMYFGHHFPLTSHIRGHLLSTQMALLRLSVDNSLCWYTKGHFRIEVFQNTRDGNDMRCIYPSTSLPFYFSKCLLSYATISIETRVRTWLFLLTTHVLYATIPIATHVQIYTRVSMKILAYSLRDAMEKVAYVRELLWRYSHMEFNIWKGKMASCLDSECISCHAHLYCLGNLQSISVLFCANIWSVDTRMEKCHLGW